MKLEIKKIGVRYDTLEDLPRSLSGKIKLLCVLLEDKTWTQNHV